MDQKVDELCPGRYCGRPILENGSYSSECGACPRGFRTNKTHCIQCTGVPSFYDCSYLLFMVLIALLLHWFLIDLISNKKNFSKQSLMLHMSALCEVIVAAVASILLVEPFGTLQITSCQSQQLSDWYTLFHNPSPNYEATLHCTQEAVYPLYTVVFIFYALATLSMLMIRPWVTNRFRAGEMTIYAALYFYPILAVLQAVLGGVIYYTYPYIVIVGSLISSATHFACKEEQSMRALVQSSVTNTRSAAILLGHWLLHAFGIITVTGVKDSSFHLPLLGLVPLPTVFYILTARFTDPVKFHIE